MKGDFLTRTQYAFLLAALGSGVLGVEAFLNGMCGLAENRGPDYQCHPEASHLFLLVGIPVLLLGALALSKSTGRLPWILYAVLVAVVLLIPVVLGVIWY